MCESIRCTHWRSERCIIGASDKIPKSISMRERWEAIPLSAAIGAGGIRLLHCCCCCSCCIYTRLLRFSTRASANRFRFRVASRILVPTPRPFQPDESNFSITSRHAARDPMLCRSLSFTANFFSRSLAKLILLLLPTSFLRDIRESMRRLEVLSVAVK